MTDHDESKPGDSAAPLHGLLAEYDDPHALLGASKKVRDAGYTKWDTFTPFPVHGIERAMGIRMTRLPWIVLACALTGLATAIVLQWWTNAVDYRFISSGKPFWSIPSSVPVYFELTVLLSAFGALFGMLALNKLPHPAHPLDRKRSFGRSTDDRFFLYIEAADAKFDLADTKGLLEETHATEVSEIHEDTSSSDQLPKGLVYALLVLTVAALVPFAFFAKARYTKSAEPKIHAVGDMDWQIKFKSQRPNPFFGDEMAMRAPEPGTVAQGQLDEDEHLHTGKVAGVFARTFPPAFTVNQQSMARGKERFEIYCAPCHGYSGNGDGMVAQRAMALAEGTWVPPSVLAQDYLRQQPVGQLFDTITNGIRNMPGYGRQIPAEDRWAIILYLRALQRSKSTPASDLSDAERASLQ
jgi:mono/diheme cytochrome c family protein